MNTNPPTAMTGSVTRPRNRQGLVAIAFGATGVLVGLVPILFFVAWRLGIAAALLGYLADDERPARRIAGHTAARWGVLLGVSGFAVGCLGLAQLLPL